MNILPISSVLVGVLQPDGTGRQLPVSESPYFETLKGFSRKPFDAYHEVLMKVSGTPEREMSFEQFLLLFADVTMNGFIVMLPRIRFDDNMVCLDGHHRLAVLLKCHGPELGLEIKNNEVIALWEKSSR